MTVIIQNDQLIAEIAEHGAELISLKSKEHGLEYIWQGDPAYWGRHAPVLFPFVGRLKDDQYVYQGKTYQMGQHGFARDMDFEVIEHGQEMASFILRSTPETLEKYPFDFELVISYELGGDASRFIIKWQIPVKKKCSFLSVDILLSMYLLKKDCHLKISIWHFLH